MKLAIPTLLLLFLISIPLNAQTYLLELQPGAEEGKDAMIFSRIEALDSDYSELTRFQVSEWTAQGRLTEQHGVLGFDLGVLPENARIQSAHLSLFFDPDNVDGRGYGHYGDVPTELLIQSVTESWKEDRVNWNNRPDYTTTGQIYVGGHAEKDQDYKDIDVTGIVREMAVGKSYGFYLQMARDQRYQMLKFASSDHRDATLHPRLAITFTADGYDGTPMVTLPEVYPATNDGRFLLDLNGVAPGKLSYQVFKAEGTKLNEPIKLNGRNLEAVNLSGVARGEYFITFLLDGSVLTTRRFRIE